MLLQRVLIIVNVICIQIIPFVHRNNHEVSVTFVRNVDRNELVAKLIIEIVDWCDLRIMRRDIQRCLIVWIKNVYIVFTRSRRRWKRITEMKDDEKVVKLDFISIVIKVFTCKVVDLQCHWIDLPKQVRVLYKVVEVEEL